MKLSEKITVSRKKQGLSQVDLADILGVSRQSVSKWETDESKPDLNKIPVLAKALNVSIDWLLSEEDKEDSKEESSGESISGNGGTVVKAYPDWVDKAPGFIKNAIKKYGWIYGVTIMAAGAIFTLFGIAARVISHNFIFGRNNAAAGPDAWMTGGAFGVDAFADINNQAWTAFSAITGLTIGIGLIVLIGGIILTVILRRWKKENAE